MMRLRGLWILALIWFCALLIMTGCASPTGPAPVSPATTALTIRTQWYQQQRMMGGVTVKIDGVVVGVTDSSGELETQATTEHEITVSVEKSPYVAVVPWVASQLLPNSHERWTFFLDLP